MRGVVVMAMADAVGMAAGKVLDLLWGDPRRHHPVAGFGRLAAAWERRVYRSSRRAGMVHTALAVGLPVAAAVAASVLTRRRPVARAALTAVTTWTVLGGRSLRNEAAGLADALTAGDIATARERLPSLCGRDPSRLDTTELARATVESVAENSSDAEVAPLVWGALAGLPGLVGYRAVNTLDAMVGHRSARYERFGWAAARLDDAANLVPSRLTAALMVIAAPTVGGRVADTLMTWLRDGDRHPSPNAGQCEAAMAGALGIRLGGRNVYHGHDEIRPTLGQGRPAEPADVARAIRLSETVGLLALVLAVLHVLARPLRRRWIGQGR